jgi:hypothetical protein
MSKRRGESTGASGRKGVPAGSSAEPRRGETGIKHEGKHAHPRGEPSRVPAKSGTVERDTGYNASHGYPPGHGGPTSPGDQPAPPSSGSGASGEEAAQNKHAGELPDDELDRGSLARDRERDLDRGPSGTVDTDTANTSR